MVPIAILAIGIAACPAETFAAERPNVLLIAVDDLNDWVGCLAGHAQARTPNIDRLAARGTLFANAHCQAPLCNPSRASLLTGRRPASTGIYGLAPGIRQVAATKDVVTLPQYFHRHGYYTFTCGKIFHDGSVATKPGEEFDVWGEPGRMPGPPRKFVATPDPHPLVDWGVFPQDDREQADWQIADSAIGALKDVPTGQPFFICAGFRLPHVLCLAAVVRSLPARPR
jgi:choline-sulfatase